MYASLPTSPEFSGPEFEIWQELIWKRCGMYFSEYRMRFLRQRLWEQMFRRNMQSYREYYHFVLHNAAGQAEWQELLEVLLNQETSFFRHEPSFNALVQHVLPELVQRQQKAARPQVSLWSVGCSIGHEPYSLAMSCLELTETNMQARSTSFAVTGSDISQRALEKARRGQYKTHEIRLLSDYYLAKYLTSLPERQGYQMADRVRALVHFGHLNLVEPDTYRVSGQDVIFCQNVLIYIKPETRLEIVHRLCHRLNPGGYLFLAPAEIVGQKLPGMQFVNLPDALVYRKE